MKMFMSKKKMVIRGCFGSERKNLICKRHLFDHYISRTCTCTLSIFLVIISHCYKVQKKIDYKPLYTWYTMYLKYRYMIHSMHQSYVSQNKRPDNTDVHISEKQCDEQVSSHSELLFGSL